MVLACAPQPFPSRTLTPSLSTIQASKAYTDSREDLLQLWVHEAERTFGDRMWDAADRELLRRAVNEQLGTAFGTSVGALFEAAGGEVPPYAQLLRPAAGGAAVAAAASTAGNSGGSSGRGGRGGDDDAALTAAPYAPVRDAAALRAALEEVMDDAAAAPSGESSDAGNARENTSAAAAGAAPRRLALFRDAALRVCRIQRILTQRCGHALLVGVSGSGRKSLARLAARAAGMAVVTVAAAAAGGSRGYRFADWREDLKKLLRSAGVEGCRVALLLDERQLAASKGDAMLGDVNSLLASGEVPGLWPKVRAAVRACWCSQ